MRRHFLSVTSNLLSEHHFLSRPCTELLAEHQMMEHALHQCAATTTGEPSSRSLRYGAEVSYLLYPKETLVLSYTDARH